MKTHKRILPLKQVRSNDMIPGVVYGRSMENVNVQVPEKVFTKTFETYGKSSVFTCDVDGNVLNTYIKSVQRDTFNPSKILHFDLVAVNEEDRIQASIPVHLTGKEFVEKQGFVVNLTIPHLNASYKATYSPEPIVVDVSQLKLGDVKKISDFQYPDQIEVHNSMDSILLSISKAK